MVVIPYPWVQKCRYFPRRSRKYSIYNKTQIVELKRDYLFKLIFVDLKRSIIGPSEYDDSICIFYERIKNIMSCESNFWDKFSKIMDVEEYLKENLSPFFCILYKIFLPLNERTRNSKIIFEILQEIFDYFLSKFEKTIKKYTMFEEMFDENQENKQSNMNDFDINQNLEKTTSSISSIVEIEDHHDDHIIIKNEENTIQNSNNEESIINELQKSQCNKNSTIAENNFSEGIIFSNKKNETFATNIFKKTTSDTHIVQTNNLKNTQEKKDTIISEMVNNNVSMDVEKILYRKCGKPTIT